MNLTGGVLPEADEHPTRWSTPHTLRKRDGEEGVKRGESGREYAEEKDRHKETQKGK